MTADSGTTQQVVVDLGDVQGNVVRGYGLRFPVARHIAAAVPLGNAAGGRAFVGELVDGDRTDGVEIARGTEWDEAPGSRVNIGITWPGLRALGLPSLVLEAFPPAFQAGAAARAQASVAGSRSGVGLGDVGPSDPARWVIGGPRTPDVHFLLSIHARDIGKLNAVTRGLRGAFQDHGLEEVWDHDAARLRDRDGRADERVHFGYVDGISQPNVAGTPPRRWGGPPGSRRDTPPPEGWPDNQPLMPTGDLLLGCGYENSFCGNYAGGLPGALADNATYGAFRMLEQRAAAFEKRLQDWSDETGVDPEMIAAKLMGRWRNGAPLVLAPDTDDLGQPTLARGLNAFDYPPDDTAGARCPIGSHIRRLNPRGSLVMGKPYSRRLVRRSLPYGPERRKDEPDERNERGLIGYFLCADLEAQWEFIQRVWVHDDIATTGIRGTREPIGGTQYEDDGAFFLSTANGGPIELGGLQTLTYTRGSAYCLLPGIGGLRWIAAQDGEGGGR